MFRPVSLFLSTGLLALSGLASTAAFATDYCDNYLNTVCTDSCYVYTAPVINGECDLSNALVISRAEPTEPPPSPSLQCEKNGGSYRCEAWPQSDELSYVWTATVLSSSTQTAATAQHDFACGTGTVTVSIITSLGATSTATATVPPCN